ncbi:MAG TPA: T9SS type A sorting domain-containing protein [Ignavibacteriaceae bacterium]|nr:T9SS type A sorting domain-containing protein [Ignavibacteriaceae bacterium]
MKKIALLIFCCLFSFMSYAQSTLLVENFDYGTTNADSISGLTTNWVRHSGTTGPSYTTSSLSYAGYISSGIGGKVNFITGQSGDVNRVFPEVTLTSNIYISFLVSLDSAKTAGDYFFHTGPNTTVGGIFRARVFAKSNGAGWSIGLAKSNDTPVPYDTTVLNFGQTYLVILKYMFNTTTATDDQVGLWIYESGVPTVEGGGTPKVTFPLVGNGVAGDPVNIGMVAIRQGSGAPPSGSIDGIRVSNVFDFVPVELTSFTAIAKENSVQLNWSTATELNNFGFDVEKSLDNKNWNKISFVNGNGTSTTIKHYSVIDKDVKSNKYYYRLKQIDNNGSFEYSKTIEVNLAKSLTFNLAQNYPNPFNPSTVIAFSVPTSENVKLTVYNSIGQAVKVLVNDYKEAGSYKVTFNASDIPTGIYFYKLESGSFSQMKKMILIK